MYLLSILATCVNTKWWVGYVTSIVPGILDSLLEPFWRFLDNFVLFFNHQKVIKKTSRSHQEAAETPSRRPKTSSRSDKTCQIVTKFLNIFANFFKNLGLPESIKNRQEVPRSAKKLFKKSRRSIKIPSSAHFLFKFVQWDRGLRDLRNISYIYEERFNLKYKRRNGMHLEGDYITWCPHNYLLHLRENRLGDCLKGLVKRIPKSRASVH